jgi:deazaflavin-dependent oxidoreductase (nitroreductase family)
MTIEDRALDGASPTAAEHVRQYLESSGAAVDHPAQGSLIVLYTTGRVSGEIRRTPVRFFEAEDDLIVAASYRGAPIHPHWYLNLLADPNVWVRRDSELYPATAKVLGASERDRLWEALIVVQAPPFAEYQAKTDRTIPLVRLVPAT